MPSEFHVDGIARRAGYIAHQNALFAQHAIHERRLPHIGPSDDRDARLWHLGFLFLRLCRGQPFDHLVEKVADAQSVFG